MNYIYDKIIIKIFNIVKRYTEIMKYRPMKTYNRLVFGYIQPSLLEQASDLENVAKKYRKLANVLSALFIGLMIIASMVLLYFVMNHSLFDVCVSLVVASIVAFIVNKICGNLYSLKPFYKIIYKDAQ